METYVRTNVRTLRFDESTHGVFSRLIRYAYEFQYLAFSRVADAMAWFEGSTWFRNDYLATGVIDEARWRRLVGVVGRLCACHVVDRNRFHDGRPLLLERAAPGSVGGSCVPTRVGHGPTSNLTRKADVMRLTNNSGGTTATEGIFFGTSNLGYGIVTEFTY